MEIVDVRPISSDSSRSLSARKVAVIGAGSAGLVAARELSKEGHQVQVFEQGQSIGGIWCYQDEVEDDLLGKCPGRRKVHSSLYSSLRVNLPREIMSFSDFPFTPEVMGGRSQDRRRYPHHTEVLGYLEAFVQEFDLRPLIRFGTRVVDVSPVTGLEGRPEAPNGLPSNGREICSANHWIVKSELLPTADLQVPEVHAEVFDAVIVAVGNYHEPNLPDVEGMEDFPGLQMHCHNFRHNEVFTNKTVVVVGASFSGEEIARQIADVALHVYHSARTWSKQLTEPQGRANLTRMPMLTRLGSNGRADFFGGVSADSVDAVVYCTGYQYSYPFLKRTGLICTDDNRVTPLYRHIFVPSVAPTLAFIGLLWKSLRNSQFELQAKWVAQVLSGRVALPTQQEMEADMEAFYELLKEKGIPVRYTHCQNDAMPVSQWEYNNLLRESCSPVPPPAEAWRARLHDAISTKILESPDTFRDEHSAEEQALFDDAAQACAEMWAKLKARRSA